MAAPGWLPAEGVDQAVGETTMPWVVKGEHDGDWYQSKNEAIRVARRLVTVGGFYTTDPEQVDDEVLVYWIDRHWYDDSVRLVYGAWVVATEPSGMKIIVQTSDPDKLERRFGKRMGTLRASK